MTIEEEIMKATELVQRIKDRADVKEDHDLWRCFVKATDGLWEAYLMLHAKARGTRL